MTTVSELLTRSAQRFPNARAVTWTRAQGGGGFTYGELLAVAHRGAEEFSQMGWLPGERVLLCLEPCPEWVAGFFALLVVGLVVVPVPAETPPETVAGIARFCGATGALLGAKTRAMEALLPGIRCRFAPELFQSSTVPSVPPHAGWEGGGISGAAPVLGRVAEANSTEAGEDARGPRGVGAVGWDPAGASRALAVLAFTSGSIARPRAVELSHGNLLSDLAGLLAVRRTGPGDAFLSMLPPAHLFEMMAGILGPLACGARVLFPGPLLPNRIVTALREESITHAVCVPALLDVLLTEMVGGSRATSAQLIGAPDDLPRSVRARMGESLRTVFVGGAALSPDWVAIADCIGLRLEVGYGLTEAAPVVSMGLVGDGPPGSVGRPLPGIQVRIGTGGEIQVKGGNVMLGYHNDREANAEAFEEGWLRTGDRGSLDPEGFLFVTGRIKEAVVSANGETFYPDEAEPWYASPLFKERCVAPVPGPDGNDAAVLFVVPTSSEVPVENLQAVFRGLRAAAPSRLRVERLVLLGSPLPRTATGKIRRRVLGEAFGSGSPDAGSFRPSPFPKGR